MRKPLNRHGTKFAKDLLVLSPDWKSKTRFIGSWESLFLPNMTNSGLGGLGALAVNGLGSD
jgi:hypothetical protein